MKRFIVVLLVVLLINTVVDGARSPVCYVGKFATRRQSMGAHCTVKKGLVDIISLFIPITYCKAVRCILCFSNLKLKGKKRSNTIIPGPATVSISEVSCGSAALPGFMRDLTFETSVHGAGLTFITGTIIRWG